MGRTYASGIDEGRRVRKIDRERSRQNAMRDLLARNEMSEEKKV